MTKPIAFITGASRGIGQEITSQLLKKGFRVFGLARSESSFQPEDLKRRDFIPIYAELDDPDSVVTAAKQALDQTDCLDVFIHNAGIIGSRSVKELDLNEIRKVFEVNCWSGLTLLRTLKPALDKSESPRITMLSSGMGARSGLQEGGYAAYRLSKWLINGLIILLHAEYHSKYRINAVCPGWVRTDMGGSGAPRNVQEGADTPVWLASADQDEIPTGKFLRDRKVIAW